GWSGGRPAGGARGSRTRSREFTTYGPLFQVFLERRHSGAGCRGGAVSRPFHEGEAEAVAGVGEALQEGAEGGFQVVVLDERAGVAVAEPDGLYERLVHRGVEAEEL